MHTGIILTVRQAHWLALSLASRTHINLAKGSGTEPLAQPEFVAYADVHREACTGSEKGRAKGPPDKAAKKEEKENDSRC